MSIAVSAFCSTARTAAQEPPTTAPLCNDILADGSADAYAAQVIDAGNKEFRSGAFSDAAKNYIAANKADGDPIALYDLGVALVRLGQGKVGNSLCAHAEHAMQPHIGPEPPARLSDPAYERIERFLALPTPATATPLPPTETPLPPPTAKLVPTRPPPTLAAPPPQTVAASPAAALTAAPAPSRKPSPILPKLPTQQPPGPTSLSRIPTASSTVPAILVLLVCGLLAAVLVATVGWRMRLVKLTRSLLNIQPSLDLEGPTSFPEGVRIAWPATKIQASFELGEASFEGDVPVVRREVLGD